MQTNNQKGLLPRQVICNRNIDQYYSVLHKLRLIRVPIIIELLLNKLPLGSQLYSCFLMIGEGITETGMPSILLRIIFCKYINVKMQNYLLTCFHSEASVPNT